VKPRFLLDEHVNRAIQRQLRRLANQIEVLAIGDPEAPPTGTLDPEILVWLESHGYLLITANRSTMPGHFTAHLERGHHIPGIIWLRPGISLGRIIEELYLIWTASRAEEYQDALLFIPL
jgi:Domain of unknown function (DUF5615)